MYKYYFYIAILLTVISCSRTKEITVNNINTNTIETKYYKINYTSITFKINNDTILKINDTINTFINNEISEFTNSIDNDIKELIDSDNVSGKYELNINTEYYITTYGFISVIFNLNYYTLGAHGNTYFKSINYDVKNERIVNLTDIVDLSNKNKLDTVNKLLSIYFLNKDSCFSEQPKITKEFNIFTIQEDSISVYYAPYELGAYSCGSAIIQIPINKLP